MPTTSSAYPADYFTRLDETDDALFYLVPRLVTHIDSDAIETLTDLFAELIVPNSTVLDLMSSWRTHLPTNHKYERVIGLGMNATEMAENRQLDEQIVHDINAEPILPFEDGTFDAVLCTVSIQYMTKPLELFQEVNRVLKVGGHFIISFSNRCFPEKAVAIWGQTSDADHIALISSYFKFSGNWQDLVVRIKDIVTDPPSDPLYMIWGQCAESLSAPSDSTAE